MNSSVLLRAAAGALIPCLGHSAITFNIHFDNENEAGLAWSASQIGVVAHAATEWGQLFVDDYTVNLTATFTNAGTSGYLGQWEGVYEAAAASLRPWSEEVSHEIRFNADLFTPNSQGVSLWWDPTPSTADDLTNASWDALTVARHEFGHLLGFTANFYFDDLANPGQTDPWSSLIDGSDVFDPGGLNVQMEADLAHIDDSGVGADDLMISTLVNGARREISVLDGQMLSLAYGYHPLAAGLAAIPEPSTLPLFTGVLALCAIRRPRRAPRC
ncbi:MAG: PEP-CTERM sorting domain-containing protein [Verrucomicrobiota bacterium]